MTRISTELNPSLPSTANTKAKPIHPSFHVTHVYCLLSILCITYYVQGYRDEYNTVSILKKFLLITSKQQGKEIDLSQLRMS